MASSSLFLKVIMIDKDLIKNITEGFLLGTDMFLVEASVRPGNIIVVEIDSEEGVSIDDCIALSRNIESQLDREKEDFELEVGSVGITSPFRIPRQYKKNIGNEVETLTKSGQKLSGILKSADESSFVLTITKMVKPEGAKKKVAVEEDLSFAFDEVKYTKYLIRFK
ncbi:ribosome maturation factor RimP [Dysgonomonas sp. PFB1-18]|nr:ribosome maturation factor RimP [Dysgonomonas sp. PF1-14]MDH6338350.1 ribosome maturation factor RimP [Dysgonomonas sp. PF1-16]MDH6379847.1 ribosome maturation factor RimP [Dysgonomonas sp. PFB1-18]MDH6397063.1 ribosome maturation factor RimP [Dysgonomonas sp. PF1-23]